MPGLDRDVAGQLHVRPEVMHKLGGPTFAGAGIGLRCSTTCLPRCGSV